MNDNPYLEHCIFLVCTAVRKIKFQCGENGKLTEGVEDQTRQSDHAFDSAVQFFH